MTDESALIPAERIEQAILLLRGQKVMLDRDLAALYGVETKNLNKAVKRNLDRFPADFMFQLTAEEAESVRFQFGTIETGPYFRYLPYAFTAGAKEADRVPRSRKVRRVPRAEEARTSMTAVAPRVRDRLPPFGIELSPFSCGRQRDGTSPVASS